MIFGKKNWILSILLISVSIFLIIFTGCGDNKEVEEIVFEELPTVGLIKVGISPDWTPFEQIEPTGELVGFDVDLMKNIASEADFEFEFIQTPFENLLTGLGRDYNVAISALLKNDEREEKYLLSDSYLKLGLVLVVPTWNRAVLGINDVSGKKAAALEGSLGKEKIEEVDPTAFVSFNDNGLMFEELASENRKIDIIVTDYLTAMEYIALFPGELKGTQTFTGEEIVIVIDRNSKDILTVINYGLREAEKNYLIKDVVIDWISVPPDDRPEGFIINKGR